MDESKRWVANNLSALVLAAQTGYAEHGRGMILASFGPAGRHPAFAFVPLVDIPDDADSRRMVQEYDPGAQLVVSVVREGFISSYQVEIPGLPKRGGRE